MVPSLGAKWRLAESLDSQFADFKNNLDDLDNYVRLDSQFSGMIC